MFRNPPTTINAESRDITVEVAGSQFDSLVELLVYDGANLKTRVLLGLDAANHLASALETEVRYAKR